jgi:hypothetical protein
MLNQNCRIDEVMMSGRCAKWRLAWCTGRRQIRAKRELNPFQRVASTLLSLVLRSRHKLSALSLSTFFHSFVKIVSTAREGHIHIILAIRVVFSFMENVR